MFILINGAGQPDPGDDERDGVSHLPAPGFARVAGTVHVVGDLRGPVPGVAACGLWLRRAELWRRRPTGQLCLGCFGGEAVAAALRRP